MPRVEELPDDFEGSLDELGSMGGTLLDRSQNSEERHSSIEQSPDPGVLRNLSKDSVMPPTNEDLVTMFDKTPLFMNSLDNAADDEGENVQLDALRALQYEGTRAEIAQGFKDRGNESVAEKTWTDAREFYSKGLAVLAAKEDQWEKPENSVLEGQRRNSLEETLRANRAMVQLELSSCRILIERASLIRPSTENYRSTIFDCVAALKLNPNNTKALYRCAVALLALERHEEASTVCQRGLDVDEQNIAMKNLLERIKGAKNTFEMQKAKRKAEHLRTKQEQLTLATALKARGIKQRTSAKPPDLDDAAIHLEPDALSPKSELVFPVVFLYPLHEQSDFVKGFREVESINDHLQYIFPLPWDETRFYMPTTVDCFMDTVTGGLVKVGKKLSMLRLLNDGNVEIVDGLVKIHTVPAQMAGTWIAQVKARKGS
ncbi:MAG: hypothetical protein Q9160_002230 [Pyrenula sp. 1 TL-2023]